MPEATDVLICGCGPVGALLACLLVDRGRSVVVVERHTRIFPIPRAVVLDDESLRTLQGLGLLDALALCPTARMTYTNARRERLASMELPAHDRPLGHPVTATFSQPELEGLLRARLEGAPAARLLTGHEVKAFHADGDGVDVDVEGPAGGPLRFRARFLVGCDGAHSLVARTLDGEVEDLGWSQDWLVADVQARDDDAFEAFSDDPEMRCERGNAEILFKGVHRHIRIDRIAGPPADDELDPEHVRARLGAYVDDTAPYDITRVARYTFRARSPRRWREGRVFLAGDAAHQTPPFAGQGLNMGFRDASNLAFKLDLVLTGAAGDALLDTYARERRPPTLETIRGAIRAGQLPTATHPLALGLRSAMFWAVRTFPPLADRLRASIIHKPPYKEGLLGTHRLAGHLLPQPLVEHEGGPVLLDEVLGAGFALLVDEAVDPATRTRAASLGVRVVPVGPAVDTDRALARWRRGASAVLVRPDRYVFDAGTNVPTLLDGLERALSR